MNKKTNLLTAVINKNQMINKIHNSNTTRLTRNLLINSQDITNRMKKISKTNRIRKKTKKMINMNYIAQSAKLQIYKRQSRIQELGSHLNFGAA